MKILYSILIWLALAGVALAQVGPGGSAAAIIDSGTKANSASATGVQIQAAASWAVGNGAVLQPGEYWLALETDFSTSGTNAALLGTNFGSPAQANLGYILTSGSAVPSGPVVSKAVAGLGTTIVACPSSFTAVDNQSGGTPFNAPIVFLGL